MSEIYVICFQDVGGSMWERSTLTDFWTWQRLLLKTPVQLLCIVPSCWFENVAPNYFDTEIQ
jgi:hypothetical protein